MIESIIQKPNGYSAVIDEQEWYIPNEPGNRHWQMVQDAIEAGASVSIEEPVKSPIPNLTFPQMLIGLVSEKWITEVEGEEWLKGTLPAAVNAVIDQIPKEHQFIARARALRPSEVVREDPLVMALAAFAGKTPEELNQFFETYSRV